MTITSKFNGRCAACGYAIAAGSQIEWSRGAGARHLTTADCQAAKAARLAANSTTVTAQARPIAAFIQAAKDRGLKFPKVRFLAPGGGELRLSLAGEGSAVPGSIQVKIDEAWIGRIEPDGTVYGRALGGNRAVLDALDLIAMDPAAAAKAYGALMCRCSFCNTALTDAGSVEVGYGPVCAKHWGLPHAPKGTPILTKTVAA